MLDRSQVLIIEDDPVLGPSLLQRLRLEGFAPRLAPTGEAALKEFRRNPPLAVVSDIRLPDMSGEDVFFGMLKTVGLVPVYFVTAFGEIDQAVRLIKAGAKDYLTKPVDADALVDMLKAAIRQADRQPKDTTAAGENGALAETEQSPAMRKAGRILAKFARSDMPVLLRGETGVGKEVAARRLHALSRPEDSPFVAVNCAAIPGDLMESTLFGHEKGAFTGATARKPGLAELAGEGSLFLDEVAELPPDLQAKLLRLIQEGRFLPLGAASELSFRGRIIAATHADIEARIAEGRFREDLFYRINVLELTLPPLRERAEDLPHLAAALLEEANARLQGAVKILPPQALAALQSHDWPGNVRELRNRIERAVVMAESEELSPDDLFPERQFGRSAEPEPAAGALQDTARDAIRKRVQAALEATGGNQTEAARLLGVSRTTVWKYAR